MKTILLISALCLMPLFLFGDTGGGSGAGGKKGEEKAADSRTSDTKVDEAKEFYKSGEYARSVRILEGVIKDRKTTDSERCSAMILLARNYVRQGKKDKELEKLLPQIILLKKAEFQLLEYGGLCLEMNRFNDAAECAKTLMACDSSAIKAEAIYMRARAEFGLENYQLVMQLCDDFAPMVEKAKKEAEAKDTFSVEQVKYLNDYFQFVAELKERARDAYEGKLYGIDYVNYRKGRVFQFKGKLKEAIEAYSLVQMPGVLKEASTCYAIHCMALAGEDTKVCSTDKKECKVPPWKHAIAMYEDFIKADPKGLYREEAYIELAELIYRYGNSNSDAQKALKITDDYFLMLAELKNDDAQKDILKALNKNIVSDFVKKNPAQFVVQNDVGQLVRTLQKPETIINRLCAPWYPLEKEIRAWLLKGFLLGQLNDKYAAYKAYEHAWKLGEKKIFCSDDTLNRLLAGLCDSSYMLPKNVRLNKLRKKTEFLLPYATFLHLTERQKEAEELFKSIEKSDGKAVSDYEKITLKLVESQFLFDSGKVSDALKIQQELHTGKTCKKLPHWPMNAYFYANCLTAAGQKNKAYEVYQNIIDKCNKKSEYSPLAMLAFAVYATNCGDKAKAIEMCSELIKQYSKTGYKYAAKTLRKALKKAEGEELIATDIGSGIADDENEPEDETFKPNVVQKNIVIVIPDNPKWVENIGKLKKSDIVNYNVRLISRDVCIIIEGLSVKYPLDEPQIPAVSKGNFISYVRVPYLFDKSLRYDFANAFTEKKSSDSEPIVDDNGEFIQPQASVQMQAEKK